MTYQSPTLDARWNRLSPRRRCQNIVRFVADNIGVPSHQVMSSSRKAPVSRARHIACYLIRHMVLGTTTRVGGFMGFDRSTVAHSLKVVERMRSSDPAFDRTIREWMGENEEETRIAA